MAKTESNRKSKKYFCCCFTKPEVTAKESSENQTNLAAVSHSSIVTKVPYSGELPNNLSAGNAICITGLVLPNCIRFAVNLKCGKEPYADIAFHFNPRLNRRYIVRNSFLKGHWGKEETASIVKYNLQRNEKFEIDIFIAKEEYLVSINGVHFCSYKFRVPLHLSTDIEIQGDVDIFAVDYRELAVYPQNLPNALFNINNGDSAEQTPNTLAIPFVGQLPKGFQDGWQLEICGRVKLLPQSFYINLQEGAQMWPHPIIPLHLNPRFVGEIFVRNAWYDGHWGTEERTSGFQFSPGAPFSLTIRRSCDYFSVWLDGQLTGEFKFRGTVDKIDTVCIEGDVILNKIIMHEKLIDLHKKT